MIIEMGSADEEFMDFDSAAASPLVLANPRFSESRVLRKDNKIRTVRLHIYMVLSKTKTSVLLPFGPLAIMLHYFTGKQEWVFMFSLLGMTPLAEYIEYMIEQLACCTKPPVGGFLRGMLSNATEMITSITALKKGEIRFVQLSLMGSILSNMLLVVGCAFYCGGVHNQKVQHFNKGNALLNLEMQLMAVMGLILPALLHFPNKEAHMGKSELALSQVISSIMLFAYGSYLFFKQMSQANIYTSLDDKLINSDAGDSKEDEVPEISYSEALGWLSVFITWTFVLAGYLVDAIHGTSDSLNIPITFLTVIVLPIVGNASAIVSGMRDKLDITLDDVIGSSTQISMFLIPFCVTLGWIMGKPMDLNFQLFETTVLFITVLMVAFVLQVYFPAILFTVFVGCLSFLHYPYLIASLCHLNLCIG